MNAAPPPTVRIAAIDFARGCAILAMVGYHACWDLRFFALVHFDLFGDALWLAARDAILGLFLVLVGVGLTLATGAGLRWRRFTSRLAAIGAAALAVTAASLWFSPEAAIFFGVLHHIALASVLGLAFIRLPGWAVLAAAVACVAAPPFLAAPLFDQEGLRWLGLMTVEPRSNDYVPLLPWFGLVLAGLVLGRLEALRALAGWRPNTAAHRAAVWAGRRSLALYLVHQPLLLGVLWLGVTLAGGGAPVGSAESSAPARFLAQCRATCEQNGTEAGSCVAYCRCVDAGLADEGLWPAFLNDRFDSSGRQRLEALFRSCAARRTGR